MTRPSWANGRTVTKSLSAMKEIIIRTVTLGVTIVLECIFIATGTLWGFTIAMALILTVPILYDSVVTEVFGNLKDEEENENQINNN